MANGVVEFTRDSSVLFLYCFAIAEFPCSLGLLYFFYLLTSAHVYLIDGASGEPMQNLGPGQRHNQTAKT